MMLSIHILHIMLSVAECSIDGDGIGEDDGYTVTDFRLGEELGIWSESSSWTSTPLTMPLVGGWAAGNGVWAGKFMVDFGSILYRIS